MANPKGPGRMIRKDISRSRKVASLTPESLALFCMLIPHFDSHGKMNGDPFFIKGEVVPLIGWLDLATIRRGLQEISEKTNVRWFEHEDCWYLHSLNWREHQDLRKDRLGDDRLPSFPGAENTRPPSPREKSRRTPGQVLDCFGSTPGTVPLEEESQVEGEKELKDETEVRADDPLPLLEGTGAAAPREGNRNGASNEGFGPLADDMAQLFAELPEIRRNAIAIMRQEVAEGRLTSANARKRLGVFSVPPSLAAQFFPDVEHEQMEARREE